MEAIQKRGGAILHNKKAITFLALLLIAATAVFAGGKVEERALEGSASVDLSNAEIIKIYPLNVLPNTLVAVEGEGFGSTPGVITVNGVTISTFVGWDDEAIHFRIPASAVADGALIEVGDSISEQELLEAPAGSVTVQFQVDTAKVAAATTTALREDQVARLVNNPPIFTAPLHFKGEWYKSGEYFGNREAAWDGGSKVRMVQAKNLDVWIGETVMTAENVESFLLPRRTDRYRPVKFAFEDGNDEERNLVEFESDWAFVLKKDFALTDTFSTVHSDPAFNPSTTDNDWYNAEDNTIYAAYPVP
jgi:hypothetical protein